MPKEDWTTAVGEVGRGVLNVRGYPIAELISRLTFAEAIFLTIRGELPTPAQRRLMDAALCSLLEHGLYSPTTVAARVVTSTTPSSVIQGLATGVLTIGSVTVSPQDSAELIERVQAVLAAGEALDDAAATVAAEIVSSGERLPGFGHPLHADQDPRARELERVARETGHWSTLSESLLAVGRQHRTLTGRDLTVNIDGMLGCVLSELGFRPIEMPGVAALSFMPGIIAHCVEEIDESPSLRIVDGRYVGPDTRHLDHEPPDAHRVELRDGVPGV